MNRKLKTSEFSLLGLEAVLYMFNVKLQNISSIIHTVNNEEVSRDATKAFIRNLAELQKDIKLTIRFIDREYNNNIKLYDGRCNENCLITVEERKVTYGIYLDTFNTLKNINKTILTSYNSDFNFVNKVSNEDGVLNVNYKSIVAAYRNTEMLHKQLLESINLFNF